MHLFQNRYKCGFVIMKGSGRAFCAGGDVVALYRLLNEGMLLDIFFYGVCDRSFITETSLKLEI